jgi:hypothetical protein
MAHMATSSVGLLWQEEGLTFREILDNLPTDPASLVVLAIVIVAVALVVWGNRKKGGPST